MKKKIAVVLLVMILATLGGVYFNRQTVKDFYVVSQSDLSSESQQLMNQLDLTAKGKFIYEASTPKLSGREDFNNQCSGVEHQDGSIILGCYSNQKIYVFSVTDERLVGANQTTMAHELLHAVYERLSKSERTKIDKLVDENLELITDESVKQTIAQYDDENFASFHNEAFAILGSESSEITSELEEIYSRYFNNRSVITAFAKKYRQVFSANEKKLSDLDGQLKIKKQSIEQLELNLKNKLSAINVEKARLDSLKGSDVAGYNAAVPAFNAAVNSYNADVKTARNLVDEHNKLVSQRNELALVHNNLAESLDSSLPTVKTD